MDQKTLDLVGNDITELHKQLMGGLVTVTEYVLKVSDQYKYLQEPNAVAGLLCPFTGLRYPTLAELAIVDAECAALDAMHLALHPAPIDFPAALMASLENEVAEPVPLPDVTVVVDLAECQSAVEIAVEIDIPEPVPLKHLLEIERLRQALYAAHESARRLQCATDSGSFVYSNLSAIQREIVEVLSVG